MRSSANVVEDIKQCKDNPEQGIQILKEALESGIEFNEICARELMQFCSPEVVMFYLGLNPQALHVINIFFYSGKHPAITAACLDHCNFPKTQQDVDLTQFNSETKETFADVCARFFDGVTHFPTIKLIFEKVPHLINADEISLFSQNVIPRLFFTKPLKAYAYYEKCAEEALLAICKHPEYPFLQSKSSVTHEIFAYPFYSAAESFNNKELFNLFYFHKDTHPEAREIAIKKACRKNHFDLLEAPAFHLSKSTYEKTAILFYLGMTVGDNPLLPKEVATIILTYLIQAGSYDCMDVFKQNSVSKIAYTNNKLTLFKEGLISDHALLKMIKVGVNGYCNAKDKPNKSGLHRVKCFANILASQHLSSGFKLMAAYAVLNEKTSWYESRIKAHLNTAIGKDKNLVDERARAYAEKNNLMLSVLAVNLIALIHGTRSNEFEGMSEENLLAKISKGAKKCRLG